MAESTSNPMGQIKAELTDKSKKDWREFRQILRDNVGLLQALKRDLKSVDDFGKAVMARQIRNTGVREYQQGAQFQTQRRVDRTRQLADGTVTRRAAETSEELRTVSQILKMRKDEERLLAARAADYRTINRELRTSVDLEKMLRQQQTVRDRYAIERAKGTSEGNRMAAEYLTTERMLERRMAQVRTNAAETARLEKLETARRAQAAKEQAAAAALVTRTEKEQAEWRRKEGANVELARRKQEKENARAARQQQQQFRRDNRHEISREETRERLFGDGGANLLRVQAGLMVNYAALNGLANLVSSTTGFVRDLDESLYNLQATVNVTDGNMVRLKETILDVSTQTKFMGAELADAAVNLGQAGLSAREIQESLGGVAMLASATGTDLNQSVDIATSVLGVFNKSAGQMGEVANTITQAVNDSKLSIDKLTLGLQYAGNTAAQSGVSFEELTASLGAMANAGIRSGSTLGTGLRQILVSFEKPSKGFRETMSRLGLTMEDVDLRTHGLAGAMQNLRNAGFTSSDAIKSFEIRAAAAYNALAPNLDMMQKLEANFIDSTAAVRANDIQMQSFNNTARALTATFQAVATEALTPTLRVLRDMMASTSEFIENNSAMVAGTVQLVAVLGVAAAAFKARALILGLVAGATRTSKIADDSLTASQAGLIAGLMGTTTAATAKTAALGTMGTVMTTTSARAGVFATAMALAGRGVTALLGPLGLIVTAAALTGSTLYGLYEDYVNKGKPSVDTLKESLDGLTTSYDNVKGESEKTAEGLGQVADRIDQLTTRSSKLKGQALATEARKMTAEFRHLGLELPNEVKSVDDLIDALKRLQEQMQQKYVLNLESTELALLGRQRGEKELLRGKQRSAAETISELMTPETFAGYQYGRNYYAPEDPTIGGVSKLAAELADQVLRPTEGWDEQRISRTRFNLENELEELRQKMAKTSDEGLKELLDGTISRYEAVQKVLTEIVTDQQQQTRTGIELEAARNAVARARLMETPDYIETREGLRQLKINDRTRNISRTGNPQEQITEVRAAALATQNDIDLLQMRIEQLGREPGGELLVPELEVELNQLVTERQETIRQTFGELGDVFELTVKQLDEAYKNSAADLARDLRAAPVGDFARQREIVDAMEAAGRDRLNRKMQELSVRETLLREQGVPPGSEEWFELDSARISAQREANGITRSTQEERRAISVREATDQMDRAKLDMDSAAEALRLAKTQEEVSLARARMLTAEEQRWQAQQDVNTLTANSLTETDLLEMQIETERKRQEINNQAATAAQRIIDKQFNREGEGMDVAAIELAERMESVGQSDFETRLALVQEKGRLAVERIESRLRALDESIEELSGIDTPEAAAELESKTGERAKAAAELAATEAQNDRDYKALQMEELQEQERSLLQTREYIIRLIERAKSAAEAARLMTELVQNTEALAANGEAQGAATIGELPSAALARRNAVIQLKDEVTDVEENAGTGRGGYREKKKGGGGSKGRKDRKSETETWVDLQEKRIEMMLGLLDRGLSSVDTVSLSIDTTLEEAKRRLATLETQLAGMAGRIASGNMSKEEQEKVLTLLKEQEGLLKLIEQSYARLGARMILNGDIAGGMGLIISNWSTEALDLAKVLEDGVVNTLNTALGGLSELFSSVTDGSKKSKDAMRDFAMSSLKAMQQLLSQMLAVKMMQSALGGLNSLIPGLDLPIPGLGKQAGGVIGERSPTMVRGGYRRMAMGGSPNRDSTHILAQPGEYLLRKSAVDMVGKDTLDQLNAMGNRTVAGSTLNQTVSDRKANNGGSTLGTPTNIYVVSPDRKPEMSPNDVVVTIADDIVRGGSVKRLIKSVVNGAI